MSIIITGRERMGPMLEKWRKGMISVAQENYQESLKDRGFGLAVVNFE